MRRSMHLGRRCRDDRPRRAGAALAARPDRAPARDRRGRDRARRSPSSSAISARSMTRSAATTACASGSRMRASISAGRSISQRSAAVRRLRSSKRWRQNDPDVGGAGTACIDRSRTRSTILHGVLLHDVSRRTSPARARRQRGHPQRAAQSGAAGRRPTARSSTPTSPPNPSSRFRRSSCSGSR